jgi:hypothetical protein
MPGKTELVWEGKYDADGKRVAPLRVALPFQNVETVNESAQERERSLFQYAAREQPWRNRLIWGDKKYVLPALLAEFAGQVNLIYIDPPFDTGADFSFTAAVPASDDEEDDALAFTKQPSIIEQKAYRDTWGRGMESYLQWFYETAVLLHELLVENGSIYVHLDWHVGHYVKVILDEVFGAENCQGEVVWKRASTVKGNFGQGSKLWSPNVESIFPYACGQGYTFNPIFKPYTDGYIKQFYRYRETDGRKYRLISMIGPGGEAKGNPTYEVMGVKRAWRYSREKMQQLIAEGMVVQTSPGAVPQRKQYLDDGKGVAVQSLWDDIESLRLCSKRG